MINFYILIFILGLIAGSFLNVVICRLKNGEKIVRSRSHCPHCKKKLNWYELIPLISFIIQLGKCRKCKQAISWQYPLVEFFTGLLFLSGFIYSAPGGTFSSWQFPYVIYNLFLWIVFCFLIVIFVYDLKHYLVADKVVYPAIIISLGFNIYLWLSSGQFLVFASAIVAALVAGGIFEAIILISKGKWMGIGDVKIGILMGLILGLPQILVALFLAFLTGAIVSIILLILKKKNLKSEIPFGPFLVLATIISLFFGGVLLNWYLGLI